MPIDTENLPDPRNDDVVQHDEGFVFAPMVRNVAYMAYFRGWMDAMGYDGGGELDVKTTKHNFGQWYNRSVLKDD